MTDRRFTTIITFNDVLFSFAGDVYHRPTDTTPDHNWHSVGHRWAIRRRQFIRSYGRNSYIWLRISGTLVYIWIKFTLNLIQLIKFYTFMRQLSVFCWIARRRSRRNRWVSSRRVTSRGIEVSANYRRSWGQSASSDTSGRLGSTQKWFSFFCHILWTSLRVFNNWINGLMTRKEIFSKLLVNYYYLKLRDK